MDLHGTVNAILLTKGIFSNEMLLKVLLYGDERLSIYSNSQITKAAVTYIHTSHSF